MTIDRCITIYADPRLIISIQSRKTQRSSQPQSGSRLETSVPGLASDLALDQAMDHCHYRSHSHSLVHVPGPQRNAHSVVQVRGSFGMALEVGIAYCFELPHQLTNSKLVPCELKGNKGTYGVEYVEE